MFRKSLFVLFALFMSNVSIAEEDNTIPLDTISNSNLQHFGLWGGYYWDLEGRDSHSNIDNNFIKVQVQDHAGTHVIAVSGNQETSVEANHCNFTSYMKSSFCRIAYKLDLISSWAASGPADYRVLLSIQDVLLEGKTEAVPFKVLKNWKEQLEEANDILVELIEPKVELPELPPNPVDHPGVKNYTAIKAVFRALDKYLFPDDASGLGLGEQRQKLIEMVSFVDEPYLGMGINTGAIQNSKTYQRWFNWELDNTSLADKKRYINFTKGVIWLADRLNSDYPLESPYPPEYPLGYYSLTDFIAWDYDYVSFDCYNNCIFNQHWNPKHSIVHTTQKLMNENWSHQEVIMVPYAGAQVAENFCESSVGIAHAKYVDNVLRQYFNFAASSTNSEIVGLLPFRWHNNSSNDANNLDPLADHFCGAYRYEDQVTTLGEISKSIGSNCCQNGSPIEWTELVGVTVTDNILTATSSWWSASAASQQSIPADGAVDFPVDVASSGVFGLSDVNADGVWDITYAIVLFGANIFIYENGIPLGSFGTYHNGDLLRVERIGSTIVYKNNGVVLYTSTEPSSGNLDANVAFFNSGDQIVDAMIYF